MSEELNDPPRGYNTEDVKTVTQSKESFFKRNRGKLILAAVILVPALLFALWTGVTVAYTFSSGERVGYVQKFSKRGWVCKTWEGELAMASIPGAMPEVFPFSVRGDAVAREIQRAGGRRVAIHYDQKKGIPTDCFGDTEYFVNRVRVVPQ
ncbi:MAG: hypothetical protein M3373_04465 [Gemmatimonadota bacterium]|nr:hypothetical protein [Gemmatimonadota bacterium]